MSLFPSPAEYQSVRYQLIRDEYKPFGASCSRFPPGQYATISPGYEIILTDLLFHNNTACIHYSPGKYKHNVDLDKRIEYEYSFGGRRLLKETVKIKCTNGIAEKVSNKTNNNNNNYYYILQCSVIHARQNILETIMNIKQKIRHFA